MKIRYALLGLASIFLFQPCFAEPSVGKPSNVELTIYNQNFALVKENRSMTLDKGINYVPVLDVAASIRPSTVAFKSLTDPNSVVVREQNYQYDLINPGTILEKSIGKKVGIRTIVDNRIELIEGTLLSAGYSNPNSFTGRTQVGVVVQTDKGILIDPVGEIIVYELPQGLISRPTLEWKLEASKAGQHNTQISYLANQMSWIADYVAVIDKDDKFVDLTGWVTLTNNSGTTYENASLNLMAGDVNVVQDEMARSAGYGGMYKLEAPAPQFAEKSFFEYHLYTLAGKTTVKNKESKQITLMTANKVPAKKVYLYDGRQTWWNAWRYNQNYRPGDSYDVSANKKVNVFIEAENRKENNLGMPLPKGTVRVYKQEENANQHFIGEDTIDHTPKDEKIRLYLGDAFDIVGEHKRASFKRIAANVTEESFEISIRNHKDVPVSVVLIEHQFGDWEITQSSHKHVKKDASTIEIIVDVPKDGETKVNYTVRTSW